MFYIFIYILINVVSNGLEKEIVFIKAFKAIKFLNDKEKTKSLNDLWENFFFGQEKGLIANPAVLGL